MFTLTAKRHVKHNMMVDICTIILKDLLLAKKTLNDPSDDRMHAVNCVLNLLVIYRPLYLKYGTVGFIGLMFFSTFESHNTSCALVFQV